MALDKLQWKSANSHLYEQAKIRTKLAVMNYKEVDLIRMVDYLEERAPIIIHFDVSTLEDFLKDPYYRNLFETDTEKRTSRLAKRMRWENYLFDGLYDKAKPSERVKYGVMNFFNDRKGNWKCQYYGESYMVLGKSVR
jgi:hypothetical protein